MLEDSNSVGLEGVDMGLIFVAVGKEIAVWKRGLRLVLAKTWVGRLG